MKFQLNLLSKIFFLLIIVSLSPLKSQSFDQYLRVAKSLQNQHDYEQALVVYLKIYTDNRNHIDVLRGINTCYQAMQQYDELIRFMEQAQATSPRNLYIPSYLAEAYFLKNQRATAQQIWWSHIKRNSRDIAVYRIVASSMISLRMFDDAIKVYDEAMSQLKSQYNLYIDIANLNKIQLKYAGATRNLLEYYIHNPKQFSYIQRQILGLADESDQISDILATISNFISDHPDQTAIKEILAGLYIKNKDFDQAFSIYQSLENEQSAGSYLAKFANEAKGNNALEYALSAYQQIIAIYPESPFAVNAQINIANAHMLLGYRFQTEKNLEKAGFEMQTALSLFDSLSRNAEVHTQRLESHQQIGDIYSNFYFDLDKAIDHYKYYVEKQRQNSQRDGVIIKLADTYLKKNLLEEADQTYTLITQKEYQPLSRFKRIEILFYKGQFEQARLKYQELRKSLTSQHHLYNDVLERENLIRSFSDDPKSLSAYGKAELLLFQQKKSESAKMFSDLARTDKKISVLAGRKAGQLYLNLAQLDESREILLYLLEHYPQDMHRDEILYNLAQVEELGGNYPEALNLYTEILTNYTTSLYVNQARQNARMVSQKISKDQS